MSTEPSSLEKAFRAEVGSGAVVGVDMDAEQLDMLRDADTGKLPANVFMLARKRGAGRPLNSRNKRSDTLAKLVCQQHGDPVLFMASLYSMPLDQLIELALIADSTKEREDRLYALVERCEERLSKLFVETGQSLGSEVAERLANSLENIVEAARNLKSKPGDIAIKALALQMQAAREVAPYVHSKKPVEANVNVNMDFRAVVVERAPESQVGQNITDGINKGLLRGPDVAKIRIIEGEYTVIDDGEGDDE